MIADGKQSMISAAAARAAAKSATPRSRWKRRLHHHHHFRFEILISFSAEISSQFVRRIIHASCSDDARCDRRTESFICFPFGKHAIRLIYFSKNGKMIYYIVALPLPPQHTHKHSETGRTVSRAIYPFAICFSANSSLAIFLCSETIKICVCAVQCVILPFEHAKPFHFETASFVWHLAHSIRCEFSTFTARQNKWRGWSEQWETWNNFISIAVDVDVEESTSLSSPTLARRLRSKRVVVAEDA